VIIMNTLSHNSRIMGGIVVFFLCIVSCLLIPAATGADVDIEASMGETITLHGSSYVGDSVYLFMTGPGLPANGVTLSDTSQRADQGHFTVVSLDDNQEWTYVWKTSRISSEIDPGTYTVYVTNEPSDLAHLGGSGSYKTLSVFLKDSGVSKISIDAAHSYTLNPEDHESTPLPAPSMNLTNATTAVTSPPAPATTPAAPVQPAVPTTRAGSGPLAAVSALVCCGYLVSLIRARS
jgi:hypothetical protein